MRQEKEEVAVLGRPSLGIAVVALALLLVPASASAGPITHHVNDSGDAGDGNCEPVTPNECTLRDAADDAADMDTIIIDDGIDPGLVSGSVAFNADVTIIGQGVNETKIYRNTATPFRGIRIGNLNAATVEIRNLTIGGVGGEGFRTPDGADGAAGQVGAAGAGIENNETLTLDGVRVTGNRTGDGGDGTATSGGDGGPGAGIVTGDNSLTVKNSTIDLNVTGNGGAATGAGNPPGEGGHGGGIGQIAGSGSIVVINSTISDNHAGNSGPRDNGENTTSGGNGGGIYAYGTSLKITNSTISDNFAGNGSNDGVGTAPQTATTGGVGGGIFVQSSAGAALASATIAGNTAGGGGSSSGVGGGNAGNSGGIHSFDTVSVKNTLFDGNTFGGGVGGTNPTCGGDALTDGGHNIEFPDGTGCPLTFLSGDPDTNGLAANGGPTKTVALGPASFAIGKVPAVDCTDLAPVPQPLTTDQRGAPRTLGEPCDVGAYEVCTVVGGSAAFGCPAAPSTPPGTTPTVTPTVPATTTTTTKKCKKGRKLVKGKCKRKKKKK